MSWTASKRSNSDCIWPLALVLLQIRWYLARLSELGSFCQNRRVLSEETALHL